jgi:hypothetical protein
MVQLAFADMLLMWLVQHKSELNVTPMYLQSANLATSPTPMACEIYNLVDVHAEHILTPSDNRTRGNAAYRTLYTTADVYQYSFFPRTIITWNTIPPTLRQVNTIDQFQAELGSITLPVLSQM